MRIIGGNLKKSKLKSPTTDKTRPTSDKMRGALFNSLRSRLGDLEEIIMVDAFAGTGAIGIEALSRGASVVIFFETDPAASKVLKQNLEKLDVMHKSLMYGDALTPPRYSRCAHVVFMDPPYNFGLIPHALRAMRDNGYIGPETVIIAETHKSEDLNLPEEFELEKKNTYGIGALHWIVCRE